MGLRPTKTNEGASDRCRGINNLNRAFNRAGLAVNGLERQPEADLNGPSAAKLGALS